MDSLKLLAFASVNGLGLEVTVFETTNCFGSFCNICVVILFLYNCFVIKQK